MDTLRKLSSMGRSKESKEAAKNAVEQQQAPVKENLLNGDEDKDTVSPSPPRARVTDDDVDDAAGDDDGYDSAVEKIGTSSTPSVAEESQTPKAAAAAPMSFASALRQGAKDTETVKVEDARNQNESSSIDDELSSRNDSSEEAEEGDKTVTRQVSIRAMPVAKISNEEEEDDDDEDDETEAEIEEEYEEANDEVLAEDDDSTVQGDTLPRIIARETGDDEDDEDDEADDDEETVEEELEQAASIPLPDQSDDQVEKSLAIEESSPALAEAEEETSEVLKAVDKEEDSSSDVVESSIEVSSSNVEGKDSEEKDSSPDVEEKVFEEKDSSPDVDEKASEEKDSSPDVEEKASEEKYSSSDVAERASEEKDTISIVEEEAPEEDSSPNVAEKSVEEDDNITEVVESSSEEVTRDDSAATGVEEEERTAPKIVTAEEPLDLSQLTSSLAEPKSVDTGVKEEVAPEVAPLTSSKEEESVPVESISRGASSSLLEELRKLSESRSLPEPEPDVVAAPADEPSQKQEESEPVTRTASSTLLDELKKLSESRLLTEASEKLPEEAEQKQEVVSAESEEPRVLEQMVVDIGGDGARDESVDELKKLTLDFHTQGRSDSDASKVESALEAASDLVEEDAVTDKNLPEVAEVKILEDTSKPDEVIAGVSKEQKEEEGLEAAVPTPAIADVESPALKSQNGDETVQVKPRGFSAADFIDDSDAEDVDDEDDDEDEDDDDEDRDETDMDTAKALAELANAVGKSESGNKPSMGAAGPSLPSLPQRPAVRKSAAAAATALDTAGRITQRPAVTPSTQLATTTDDTANGETAEGNETREKLQNIRVKFLRLAHRLGQSPQNVVVAQVLYRLGLAESLRGGSASTASRTGAFSFDRANALAEEQEAANQEEELDFACTILVLGKTGVGKSATINSIFDDRKSATSAFKPSTTKVQEIVGTVHGIKVRVIDTPGLLPSQADQQHNERIMGQVKKHIKKASPDIVLYFDRLDMQSRDFGDLPLLRTITDLFGAAVWFNAIVVLTHASSAPPDGPNGVPLSYEMFVLQRSHVVQQTIRQAAGDMRLMNPVSLVENHPACRTNRNGQRVLPNGQIWKPQLLLLCFASKILAEANSLLKLQETATPGRPFGQRSRVPPLPFLLSSLLQSRAQLKLPDEQVGESDESDDEEEEEDSDADDYDELPPFRPLSKEELEELDKEQKQDYLDEIADRERLFQKKQYREEMRRRKEMKKRAAQMSKEELAQPGDEADDEAGKAAAVPVPMPDMALPPSFDSDNPTHRYRYLETANQWLVRPVLETHGWDHDAGYDGFNVEKMFVVKDKIPASISGQVTKDKKEAQVNFEAAASLKHGEGKVTLTGFDIQTIGKDLAYTLRAETRFNNFKRNKTTAGLTCTVLNDTIAAGLKLEDRILIGKRIKMVVNGGVLTGKGDKAFGGSLEATLRGKEYPLSRTLSTLGLSVMDWHGDLAIGGNLQSQFMVGKTMLVGRANLNNRGSGQVSIRASSSEQLQMVLIGIVPILRSLINCRFGFGGQSSQ